MGEAFGWLGFFIGSVSSAKALKELTGQKGNKTCV